SRLTFTGIPMVRPEGLKNPGCIPREDRGTSPTIRAYLRVTETDGAIDGNLLAGSAIRRAHDAQERWLYRGRGDLPHAWHRRHHGHLHGGQRRASPPASLRASRTTSTRLYGISDLSQQRPAAFLDPRPRLH